MRGLSAAAILLMPLLLVETVRGIAGAPFSVAGAAGRLLFVSAVLLVARMGAPFPSGQRSVWPWAGVCTAAVGVAGACLCALRGSSLGAWLSVGALLAATLWPVSRRPGARLPSAMRLVSMAFLAGAIPVAAAQIESGFAEEEFFAAIQALVLFLFSASLALANRLLGRPVLSPERAGVTLPPGWLFPPALPLLVAGLAVTVHGYQRSFYARQAPSYPGISTANPFLCGTGESSPRRYTGEEVFRALLARVQANPHKASPEYGMLALALRDPLRADEFRTSLLREAAQGRLIGSRESKYSQYEAAARVYYYARLRTVFPRLFAPIENVQLRRWFSAIHRKATSAGPMDLLYALAFAKRPEAAYDNQEIGAGLLAVLDWAGLLEPQLDAASHTYLNRLARGWSARFRNTDDSFGYQPVWINNAFFQSLRSTPGTAARENARRSFDWLLKQAPPDGESPDYNPSVEPTLAGTAYLGASLFRDERLLWLAGRTLENEKGNGRGIPAQPGAEQPVALEAVSPSIGSCLLYGDSGLPTQVGPIAPDKIVFRDGWREAGPYLLLNLRFAGWHRYRATNAIVSISEGQRFIAEDVRDKPLDWLPRERRLFRDKRVPRERLNGFLVERTGMSAVLFNLTGFGGPWAQDPPQYARVEHFQTGPELDTSTTVLADWRGWTHRRTVTFRHGGPILVWDRAAGPSSRAVAFTYLEERSKPERRNFASPILFFFPCPIWLTFQPSENEEVAEE